MLHVPSELLGESANAALNRYTRKVSSDGRRSYGFDRFQCVLIYARLTTEQNWHAPSLLGSIRMLGSSWMHNAVER